METTLHYIQFNEIGITFAVIVAAMTFVVLTWNAVKAILDWRAMAKKPTTAVVMPHKGEMRMMVEAMVVTPLPPLKRCQAGKSWPNVAPRPAQAVAATPS